MSKRLRNLLAVALLAVAGAAADIAGASAGVAQSSVVSADPADYTPNLAPDATVAHPAAYALEQSRDATTMYVGGQFDAVQDAAALNPALIRKNFVAFSATTGAISAAVAPVFNGPVWAIRSAGASLFVAGAFSTVNGVPRLGLVKLSASTGLVDPTFNPPWKRGIGYDLRLVNGRVIIAGTFPKALLALNPTTGADTGYLNVGITGTCVDNPACGTGGAPASGEPTHVYRFAVNAALTRLVAIGNFAAPHPRAFMVDLGTAAKVDPWYYQPLANACALPKVYPAYLRDVDFSPDGSYFAIVGTGYVPVAGGVGRDVCDAAARFETNIASPTRPTWLNYTGGDTLHSVVITGAAVYVQGHQRWLNNATGRDSCPVGTACVSRPGIGAIDPNSGLALAWNPTKTRNVGGKDLLSTSAGVWVASDGSKIGHEYHYGIAFIPLP